MQKISLYYNIFLIIYYSEPIIKPILIDAVKLRITSIKTLYYLKEQLKSTTPFINYNEN
jgi:hypothetical protein